MNLSLGWPVTEEQLREVANHAGVIEDWKMISLMQDSEENVNT